MITLANCDTSALLAQLVRAWGLLFVILGFVCAASTARADTFFVAPGGDDWQAGTEEAPFATLTRAQAAANPGDTVLIRGGRYVFSGSAAGSEIGVAFSTSGRADGPIRYWAYPGELPLFDFTELRPAARIRGFQVTGSYLHFRGLALTGVQQILVDQNESWAIRVEGGGSHNVFEALDLHHNEGPGLFIADGGDNLVLNVDSHHNYDPDRGGENADGFGCHSNDAGNVFRGCRAYDNSDDGFDFINAPGLCLVEHSWAFRNGYRPGTATAAGNGAGFKGGGFTTSTLPAAIPRHVLRFNVAWGNRAQGFYANHHEGGLYFIHNTAFDNARNFDLLADEGRAEHFLRNNLALGRGGELSRATLGEINSASNSWDLGQSPSEVEVESTSDMGTDGPRNADGSLPWLAFLRPRATGLLVDRGEPLGFSFVGAAPDLGAFESGQEPPSVEPPPAVDTTPDAGIAQPTPNDGGVAPGAALDAGLALPGGAGAASPPTGGVASAPLPAGAVSSGAMAMPGDAFAGGATPEALDAETAAGCSCSIVQARPQGRLYTAALGMMLALALGRLRRRSRVRSAGRTGSPIG